MSNDNDAGRPMTTGDATDTTAGLMAKHTADLRAAVLGTVKPTDRPAAPAAKPYISPLHRFSLRGHGTQLEEEAVAKKGEVCFTGDVTLWGAPHNSGKTLFAIGLLADAIMKKAMDPERAFYLKPGAVQRRCWLLASLDRFSRSVIRYDEVVNRSAWRISTTPATA